MKNLKSWANAAAISIAIFTFLSVLNALFFGSGTFELTTLAPYLTVDGVVPAYTELLALLTYAAVGIFFLTAVRLFKNQQFGLKKANIIHFLSSLFIFYFLTVLSNFPLGWPYQQILQFYRSIPASQLKTIYFSPLETILFSYVLIWLVMWFYYRHQIKQLNKKLHS